MASESGSVIHDIGFRHYDGPRLGRGWITRSLLWETLRGTFGLGRPAKDKVMPWVLIGILSAIALVMAIIVIVTKDENMRLSYTAFPVSLQLLVSMFVASRAPYAVSRDLRSGVMPLYLSRPLTRADYVLAKLGGLSAGVFLMLLIPETVLLIGGLLAKLPMGTELWGFLGGMVVMALVSIIVSAIGLAIAAYTRRRGLGIAAIMMTFILLSSISGIVLGLMGQTVLLSGSASTSEAFVAAIDPYGLVNGIAVSLLGATTQEGRPAPDGLASGLLLVVLLAAIVVSCLGILVRRYRKTEGL